MSDPFEVLGVKPRFDLDLEALEARHRDLSRTLHPDRYVGQPRGERRLALGRAIEVNDALRVLKDPSQRAMLLLLRAGIQIEEGAESKASPEFLMAMLDLREALSDSELAGDVPSIKRLGEEVAQRRARVLSQIEYAFSELSPDGAISPAQAGIIVARVGELRFLDRLLAEAHTLEDELS